MASSIDNDYYQSFALCVTLLICSAYASSTVSTLEGGFTIELIHRDSPRSPYYNPIATPSERLRADMSHSLSRAEYLSQRANDEAESVSWIFPEGGGYLMNFSIGSPPFQVMGLFDTSIGFTWTQCNPCNSCLKQVGPQFDPLGSLTYRDLFCYSRMCLTLGITSCDPVEGKTCQYSYRYEVKSYSRGNVATDMISLISVSGELSSFPGIIFGCSHENESPLSLSYSGIVGFAPNPVSLPSQMGPAAAGKFSYCLMPDSDKPSMLNFGNDAIVTGPDVVSTPVTDEPTLYELTLEGILVGDNGYKLENYLPFSQNSGNMILDSSSTFSFFPLTYYSEVESSVSKRIKMERVSDPYGVFSLCYNTTTQIDAPTLTMKFKGADVKLGPSNTFIRVSENIMCFGFIPHFGYAIFGNRLQLNFVIGYDIGNRVVSFKPTDCTQY